MGIDYLEAHHGFHGLRRGLFKEEEGSGLSFQVFPVTPESDSSIVAGLYSATGV
jgi:hypothetical protein